MEIAPTVLVNTAACFSVDGYEPMRPIEYTSFTDVIGMDIPV